MEERIYFTPLVRLKNKVEFFEYVLYKKINKLMLFDKRSNSSIEIGEYGNFILVKGEEKEEEADVYLIEEGKDEVLRLSFFYPEEGVGGIRLDSYAIKLGFKIRKPFDGDWNKGLIIGEKENYAIIVDNKKYGGKIKVENFIIVKLVDKEEGFIITDLGIYIIKGGKRGYIEKESLGVETKKISGWAKRENYLLFSIENKIIVVSLDVKNMFYFKVEENREEEFKKFKRDD